MEGVIAAQNKEPRGARPVAPTHQCFCSPNRETPAFPKKSGKGRASFFRQASFEPLPIARTLWERKRGDRSVTFDRARADGRNRQHTPAGTRRPTQVAHHSVCLMR
jgi:hypothetical protein